LTIFLEADGYAPTKLFQKARYFHDGTCDHLFLQHSDILRLFGLLYLGAYEKVLSETTVARIYRHCYAFCHMLGKSQEVYRDEELYRKSFKLVSFEITRLT
jgi:hypothetical protein